MGWESILCPSWVWAEIAGDPVGAELTSVESEVWELIEGVPDGSALFSVVSAFWEDTEADPVGWVSDELELLD